MPSRTTTCLILLAALLTLLTPGHASTVEHLNVEQMTQRADHIYQATVLQEPDRHAGTTAPATRVRLALRRVLKAEAGFPLADTIDVLLPGGVLDGAKQQISGMPVFTQGEEVVLFLSAPDAAGRRWPIGLSQAKFDVLRQAGRPAKVERSFHGMRRVSTTAQRPAGPGDPVTDLDQLLQRIARHVGQARAGSLD